MSKKVIIRPSAHSGYVWLSVSNGDEYKVGPLTALDFAMRLILCSFVAFLNRLGS